MYDNAVVMGSYTASSFQYWTLVGSFGTGVFLTLFRLYFSPSLLLAMFCFLLAVSQVLMFFVNILPIAHWLAMFLTALAYGSSFSLMGIIAHESYGIESFSKILGSFMTAGAVGLFIYEQLIFISFYSFFAGRSDGNNYSYGKWNIFIFIIGVASGVLALAASFGVYLKNRKSDGGKDAGSKMIKF